MSQRLNLYFGVVVIKGVVIDPTTKEASAAPLQINAVCYLAKTKEDAEKAVRDSIDSRIKDGDFIEIEKMDLYQADEGLIKQFVADRILAMKLVAATDQVPLEIKP